MPVASVVMPCFNAAPFVEDSVRAVLAQTLSDLEIIIVEDCSRDHSVEILHRLAREDARIRVIVHPRNRGASRSRNDGIRVARGKYIGFCDADDLWKPEKLAAQVELLERNPGYHVTYCDSEIIDATGRRTGELFSALFPPPRAPSGDLFEA